VKFLTVKFSKEGLKMYGLLPDASTHHYGFSSLHYIVFDKGHLKVKGPDIDLDLDAVERIELRTVK
jgi:hypothetical protein